MADNLDNLRRELLASHEMQAGLQKEFQKTLAGRSLSALNESVAMAKLLAHELQRTTTHHVKASHNRGRYACDWCSSAARVVAKAEAMGLLE